MLPAIVLDLSTLLKLSPRLSRGDYLSPPSCSLYLNKIFPLNLTSKKSTLLMRMWTISWVKRGFFPLKKYRVSRRGGGRGITKTRPAACLNQRVYTEFSCLWSSVFLPSALRVARWWLVWHVCHSHSCALNCFGVWHFFYIKDWAAALFSLCCRT